MNEDEIKSIRDIMFEMTNINSTNSFKNSELSRRERVKERYEFLSKKNEGSVSGNYLTKEEKSELEYVNFLIKEYYLKNIIE